ncbi:hypothetical protein F5B17DRAFT_411334 [Nemania serpens]|nr:hypothetical protein F5B17DRAFT_411334 [Nemania serpens]
MSSGFASTMNWTDQSRQPANIDIFKMAESPSALRTKLLNIMNYSDLLLECEGHEFRVHRAVVCGQSSVVAAAINGDFQVSCTSNTA